jgi:cysteine desulfurase/selenocysteine lyase
LLFWIMLKPVNTMNTNTDQPFFPDEKLLQDLANRLFKENESYSPLPVIGHYAPVNESPADPRNATTPDIVSSGTHQPHFASFGIPASAGGAGISSGVVNPINEIDLRNRDEILTDKQNSDTNKLPKSVAGSGISPSAHQQGNEVNLADPQTSLPDPHFPADSKVPPSVAGSGISPSVKYLEHNDKISEPGEERLPADIKTILESILSFDSGPQLPFSLTQVQNQDYYFLQQPTDIPDKTKDQVSARSAGKPFYRNA